MFYVQNEGFYGAGIRGRPPGSSKGGENEEKRFGGFLDILKDFETHNYMKLLLCVSYQLGLEQLAKSLVFLGFCLSILSVFLCFYNFPISDRSY